MKYVPLCSTIHPLLGKTKNHGLSTSMLMKTTGLNPYPNLMVEHIVPNIKATKEKTPRMDIPDLPRRHRFCPHVVIESYWIHFRKTGT